MKKGSEELTLLALPLLVSVGLSDAALESVRARLLEKQQEVEKHLEKCNAQKQLTFKEKMKRDEAIKQKKVLDAKKSDTLLQQQQQSSP